MAFLTDADRERIADAVTAAETKTTGEFVTVLAREADDYMYIPTLVAAAIVFLISGIVLLAPIELYATDFFAGQLAGLIVLTLLFRWPPLKMRLVPRTVRHERARRLAHQMFLDLGLSSTRERTGVMLFVAVGERYVEILADRGVHEHVDNAEWERIVADFAAQVKSGRITDGFIGAIDACTDIMAKHFPGNPDDTNELPNRLVEI